MALLGGADGLAVIRRLVRDAAPRARLGLALEVGHTQAAAVAALLADAGFRSPARLRDLGDVERVVLAESQPSDQLRTHETPLDAPAERA